MSLMEDISRWSCSIMLWRRTCLRSRILMATLLPLLTCLANFTFAKLPSPMVFPNSYFPTTTPPPFATLTLIFPSSYALFLSVSCYGLYVCTWSSYVFNQLLETWNDCSWFSLNGEKLRVPMGSKEKRYVWEKAKSAEGPTRQPVSLIHSTWVFPLSHNSTFESAWRVSFNKLN